MNGKAEVNCWMKDKDAVVRVGSSCQVKISCPMWKSVSTIRRKKLPCMFYKEPDSYVSYLFICIYIIKPFQILVLVILIWSCQIRNCMHSFIVLSNKSISPYLNRFYFGISIPSFALHLIKIIIHKALLYSYDKERYTRGTRLELHNPYICVKNISPPLFYRKLCTSLLD